jgi:hypothetical protein
MAESRVEAIEAKAIAEIELSCLKAAEDIAMAGLTSDAAKQFIAALPSIESLMPHLSYTEIAGEAEPPVVEQLLSSNALRQQRLPTARHALKASLPPLLRSKSQKMDRCQSCHQRGSWEALAQGERCRTTNGSSRESSLTLKRRRSSSERCLLRRGWHPTPSARC